MQMSKQKRIFPFSKDRFRFFEKKALVKKIKLKREVINSSTAQFGTSEQQILKKYSILSRLKKNSVR